MTARRRLALIPLALLALFGPWRTCPAQAQAQKATLRMSYATVVPDARKAQVTWRYTTEMPAEDWSQPDFDDSSWKEGAAGFGVADTPGAVVRTTWDTGDIWLRRSVEVPAEKLDGLALMIHHDEDAEVYINGAPAAEARGYINDYEMMPLSARGKAALRAGRNVAAVHCHQTRGGQYIDLGFVVGTPVATAGYHPPAVPLVLHDPYFSIWSDADNLADDVTRHWTGSPHPLSSMVRIDGKTYRLMGMPESPIPALRQTRVVVLPTQTRCVFEGDGVRLSLIFTTPALPDDLDVLGRPLTYLTWLASSQDGQRHEVAIYFDCGAELVVNDTAQEVVGSRVQAAGLTALRFGSQEQPVLKRVGDRTRIDWGYLYAAGTNDQVAGAVIAPGEDVRAAFAEGGRLTAQDDKRFPRPARDDAPVLAFRLDLGGVEGEPKARTLMLAYDEVYAVELFGKPLRPYWRRGGLEAAGLLEAAAEQFAELRRRCERFDRELMTDLEQSGGANYVRVGALAYRQTLAGCGLAADDAGGPLVFAKENTSNGCISTVDVQYPACPFFLLFSPTLMEGHLTPILQYAESPRWTYPFAPHDLGTYPKANGQVYGIGAKDEGTMMPVEESGNMLLMIAAIGKARGNASYAEAHWPILTRWAEYLRRKGFDPENQLCTDDFTGHLAHNVNLSAKAIVALGAYAKMAEMLGKTAESAQYRAVAQEFASRWLKEADDGDHFRLAFDKPGTWSQKYNLVWDQVLELGLFPADALRKEMASYRKAQNPYGLPLDNRSDGTKTDWLVWTATLGGARDDFDALVAPLSKMLADTTSRVPMTDWYSTTTSRVNGFHARPVVGGVFIKLIDDDATWRKWSARSR